MARKAKKASSRSRFDRGRAAKVLAEAWLSSDAAAARKFGLSAATVSNYRKRLDKDAELRGLYKAALEELDGAWLAEAREALRQLIRETAASARKAVAEALELDDRLRAIRTAESLITRLGELVVQREALVFDGPSEHPGEGRAVAPQAGSAGEASGSIH